MRKLKGLLCFLFVLFTTNAFAGYAYVFRFPVGDPIEQSWSITNGLGNSWGGHIGHLGGDFWSQTAANEPVYAVADGTVHTVYYGGSSWRGVVIIRHELPAGQSFDFTDTVLQANINTNPTNLNVIYSLYGHVKDITVDDGQPITKGTLLGYLCESCNSYPSCSNCDDDQVCWAPHLHFEIKNQTAINNGDFDGVGHGYSGTNGSAPNHYDTRQFILNNLTSPNDGPFMDVAADYWTEKEGGYITELVARGIAQGQNGYFYPENYVTRGELCTMLKRARNLPWHSSYANNNPFTDLPSSHSHYQSVLICYNLGFVQGVGNRFYPDTAISRCDAAKIVVKGFELVSDSALQAMVANGGTINENHWLDYTCNQNNYRYASYLFITPNADKKFIMTGTLADRNFWPNTPLKRSEIAKIICLALRAE